MPGHAAHIALLIVDRPLCIPCIAVRIALDAIAVEAYLVTMRTSLTVFREDSGPCAACSAITKVFSLSRLPL